MAETLIEMLAERVFPPSWHELPAEMHTQLHTLSASIGGALAASKPEVRAELLAKVCDEVLLNVVQPVVGEGYVKWPLTPEQEAEANKALEGIDFDQICAEGLQMMREGSGIPMEQVLEEFEREAKKGE